MVITAPTTEEYRRSRRAGLVQVPKMGMFSRGSLSRPAYRLASRIIGELFVDYALASNRQINGRAGPSEAHSSDVPGREQKVYTFAIANCHRPAAEAAPSVPSESRS
jgi:hypothetical protein